MAKLMTDQEGGLVSNEATAFFDRLEIERVLVGTEGSTAKGLVERHIQITKLAMLRFKKQSKEAGVQLTDSEIAMECCQAQNLLLDYAGGVPQVALTGVQRGFNTPDRETLDSTSGALLDRPDIAEQYVRGRNLAKQCILQALMEGRRAEASRMAQQRHVPQLLVP